MTDHAALPQPAEPEEMPLGPDKLLSCVCVVWLLNALTGAAVAIREDLPGELIGGVFTGRDASAEFFKGPGTALSPGSPTSPRRRSALYSARVAVRRGLRGCLWWAREPAPEQWGRR
jgi:hypothetical protein